MSNLNSTPPAEFGRTYTIIMKCMDMCRTTASITLLQTVNSDLLEAYKLIRVASPNRLYLVEEAQADVIDKELETTLDDRYDGQTFNTLVREYTRARLLSSMIHGHLRAQHDAHAGEGSPATDRPVVNPKWPPWPSRRYLSPEAQKQWDFEEEFAAEEEAAAEADEEIVTDEDLHSHSGHDSDGVFPVR